MILPEGCNDGGKEFRTWYDDDGCIIRQEMTYTIRRLDENAIRFSSTIDRSDESHVTLYTINKENSRSTIFGRRISTRD